MKFSHPVLPDEVLILETGVDTGAPYNEIQIPNRPGRKPCVSGKYQDRRRCLTAGIPENASLFRFFNHGSTADGVVEALEVTGLPIILVDDGSGDETRVALEEIARERSSCTLVRLDRNFGKGGAGNRRSQRSGP